jgi:thiol-disulfide isomerase/thioredoxin
MRLLAVVLALMTVLALSDHCRADMAPARKAGAPATQTPSATPAGQARADSLLDRARDLWNQETFEEALSLTDQAIALVGETEDLMDFRVDLCWKLGRHEAWLAAALKLEKVAARKTAWHCLKIAEAQLSLGRKDEAIEWIRKAIEERDFTRYQIFEDAPYDAIRHDARFTRLIERARARVGLGKPARPIAVPLLDGQRFSLSSLKGKVVLVDFWSTSCPPCRREMPALVQLYRDFRESGFEVVAINMDEDRDAVVQYVRKNGLEWKIGFSGRAWNDEVVRSYGVNSQPSKYVIDRKGVLRYYNVSGEELRAAVKSLLAE